MYRIDNNLKLMLAIDIFQNGHNEEFVKVNYSSKYFSILLCKNII